MRPKLLICDEMVSALDVSVQAQILNLLADLKAEYGLTLLFIAHDLAVVKNVSDRVAVMYLGKICEVGPPDVLYDAPAHPYTKFLLGAALEADPDAPDPRRGPPGRAAQPDQPAERLPVPHALPLRPGPLRGRGADPGRDRPGPPGRLPLPPHHRAPPGRLAPVAWGMAPLPEVVTTDRLTLRVWRDDDAPALAAAVAGSLEHLAPGWSGPTTR